MSFPLTLPCMKKEHFFWSRIPAQDPGSAQEFISFLCFPPFLSFSSSSSSSYIFRPAKALPPIWQCCLLCHIKMEPLQFLCFVTLSSQSLSPPPTPPRCSVSPIEISPCHKISVWCSIATNACEPPLQYYKFDKPGLVTIIRALWKAVIQVPNRLFERHLNIRNKEGNISFSYTFVLLLRTVGVAVRSAHHTGLLCGIKKGRKESWAEIGAGICIPRWEGMCRIFGGIWNIHTEEQTHWEIYLGMKRLMQPKGSRRQVTTTGCTDI